MTPKPTRGGVRIGSGRKPTGKTRVTIAVSVSQAAAGHLRATAAKRGQSVSSVAEKAFLRLR